MTKGGEQLTVNEVVGASGASAARTVVARPL